MDNAFKFDKVDGLPHDNYQPRPRRSGRSSRPAFADRRKAEPKFQKQDEQIKKFLERKARHSISLNEAKFRAEFVPEDPEEKAADEKAKKERKKKKFAEREVWELRLLQRRSHPDRHRLPDPRLQGPGRRGSRAGQDRRAVNCESIDRSTSRPDSMSGLFF